MAGNGAANRGGEQTVTRLLQRWQAGDGEALDQVVPLAMEELHTLARSSLRRLGSSQLQPTELVHEAYLRLVGLEEMSWEGRVQFFALASKVMRGIVIDHLRRHLALKRAGDAVTLVDFPAARSMTPEEMLDLDRALEELAQRDERKGRVAEMRLFAGMGHLEIGAALGVAERTVKRDWQFAKVWLYRRLRGEE